MLLVLQILVLITACCFIFGYGCHFMYDTLVGVASNHVAVYWSSETKKNSVSSDPKLEVLPYMATKHYIDSYAKNFIDDARWNFSFESNNSYNNRQTV